jgi:hypothetical protein
VNGAGMSGFPTTLTRSLKFAQSAKARTGTHRGASRKGNRMAKESIDPVYEYIDEKIKLAKRDLQKELKTAAKNQLVIAQFVARTDIETIRRRLTEWSLKRLSKTDPRYSKIRQYLLNHSATAKEKALHSSDPISIARGFRKECEDYFKENKLHPFMD